MENLYLSKKYQLSDNMKPLFLIAFICCLFIGCNTSMKCSADNEIVFSMSKTRCYGKCPVYTIDIYSNGHVIYEGKSNVDKIGRFEKNITQTELSDLKKAFLDSKFFDFEDEYVSNATDLPTTYILFRNNGEEKKIKDYHRAPKELKALEKLLDDIANSTTDWIQLN